MTKLNVWQRFFKDTRGDTGFVEWLLLVGLIAIAGYAAFRTVGQDVSTKANEAGTTINGITMSP
jgi:Flp pilus assembly pilin Flp